MTVSLPTPEGPEMTIRREGVLLWEKSGKSFMGLLWIDYNCCEFHHLEMFDADL
jgi:hypothetical protein